MSGAGWSCKPGEMPPKEKRRPDEVAHIAALSSTKNEKRERDPEMHQTKKGNQRYFGLKAHIGADRDSKLVHTVVTAANVADVTQTATLLHGAETQVHADAGYTGVEKRSEIVALECRIDWQIATKRGVIKVLAEGAQKDALKTVEKAKAAVRAFVEHPFHLVKNIFGHRKARYRGLLQRKQPPMNSLTESIPVAHGTANDAPAPTANSADARRWRAHEPTSDILNHPTTKGITMNSLPITPTPTDAATQRVEFFRLPSPGKRDPRLGLSRGWYYKAAGSGEIKMVALWQRGSLRGVRLVAYDSVCDYIRRATQMTPAAPSLATSGLGQASLDLTGK